MKINSITFIQSDAIPKSMRNTQASVSIKQILDQLSKAPTGQSLVISGEFKKYERYVLQKRLHKHGQKVTVSNGVHNGHPCLFVKRLTDAEWHEWMGAVPVAGRPIAAKGKVK